MIYISPSQLATFKGCRRKWAYRYIDGIKVPPKKEQAFGLEGHKRNEGWLRHGKHVGTDDVGLVCQQGIKPGYMPTPASDLLIEAKLEIPILERRAIMIGYVDCVVPPRITAAGDTLPVAHDWKFTKDLRWAMTKKELAEDSQAAVYTYWLYQKYGSPKVIARWVYFCGRMNSKSEDGRPRTPRGTKKVELTFPAEIIEANWRRELETAAEIVEVKTTYKKADEVPPTETHCDAYGGCEHRERCPLTAADDFNLGAMVEQSNRTDKQESTMSAEEIMAKVRAHKAAMLAQQQATKAEPPPVATEPQTTIEEKPLAPPAEASSKGIEVVAELQAQSGQVDTPPPPAADPGGADLLAKLQAQSGATTINPPEAQVEPLERQEAEAAAANVVVPKVEEPPPPVEAFTDGAAAGGLATHRDQPAPAEEVAQVIETHKAGAEGVAKPAKGKKGKTAKAAKVPFVLAIDAVASKLQNGALGEVIHLSEYVEPITTAIAKGHRCDEHPTGVDHWNLIEFGNGPSILAHHVANQLDTKGFSGVLVVDSHTAEGRALTDVLIRRADVVFRGVR